MLWAMIAGAALKGTAKAGNDIFQHKLNVASRKLQRSQANFGIQRASNALQTHIEETQRSGALLGQTLASRGLGKSSIAEQETARFNRLSERRRGELEKGLHIAKKYKSYLKARHRFERISLYTGTMDFLGDMLMGAGAASGGGGGGGGSVGAGASSVGAGISGG